MLQGFKMLSEARAGRAAPLIARLTDSNELDLRGVLEQLTTQLGRLVGFDACGWLICDPDTLLAVDRVSRDEPWTADFAARFCLNEYLEDDVNRFRDLAPARQPVGVLSVATRGAPESSRRYRDLLEPHGLVDELRAAMVVDGNCWGAVNLYRARPAPAFTPKDAQVVLDLSAAVGRIMRAHSAVATTPVGETPDEPGMVVVDSDGRIESMTAAGEMWLEQLRTPETTLVGGVPVTVFGLATRARTMGSARLRMRTTAGTWLTLHGAPRQSPGGPDGRVAIILQPSRQSELLSMFGRRFGWSPREQEVVGLIMHGLATRHIAQQLGISDHTVQDHLKSIFYKTGVRGRRQLAMNLAMLPRSTAA